MELNATNFKKWDSFSEFKVFIKNWKSPTAPVGYMKTIFLILALQMSLIKV